MPSAKRISELIHAIYAAAEDPRRWSAFLEMLAEEVDCGMALLVAIGWNDVRPSIAVVVRSDPEAMRLYEETLGAHDEGITSGQESPSRTGTITFSQEMISDRDRVRTGFYDFMRRFDMLHALTATILANDEVTAGIVCHYPRGGAAPSGHHRELLNVLMPHLQQGVRFQQRWQRHHAGEAALRTTLDHLPAAILLLDGRGRVVRANAAAEEVLRRADGLVTRHGRIATTRHDETSRLRAAISRAAGTTLSTGSEDGGVLAIGGSIQRLPYRVSIVPVSAAGALFAEYGAAALLLIDDPERHPTPDPSTLRMIFGWTEAEVAVALHVVAGKRPADIARERGVSLATVRSQLKSIFDKARVTSQADLVRVIVSGAASVTTPKR